MFQAALILFSFLPMIFCQCPENGIKWQTKCYIFVSKGAPFVTADLNCNNFGGHLASVHDGFTNTFLAQEGLQEFKKTKDFWIGVSNLIAPGNWSWTDGSFYDFSDWRDSNRKSSKNGQSCGAVNINDGRWNSDDCFKAKPYVCESDNSGPPPAAPTTSAPPLKTTTIGKFPESTVFPTREGITVHTTLAIIGCSEGWQYFEASGACYILTAPNLSWDQAEAECVSNGSHLASIHNVDELNYIRSLNDAWNWIGLHSNDNKTTWVYTDNSAFDYAPWVTGMPESFNYTCVHAKDVIHNDWPCTSLLYGVCKKSAYV